MSCLANRVKKGWGSWLEVIDNINKYSAEPWVATGTPNIWEPTFVRLLQEVEGIFDGTMDYARGGVYWCDTRNVQTDFFKEKILGDLENHPRAADMNTLSTFK